MYDLFQPVPLGSAVPVSLKRAITVLEPVTKSCPGLLEALYLMAKAKYLSGDVKSAASTLKHCIDHVGTPKLTVVLLWCQNSLRYRLRTYFRDRLIIF